MDYSKSRPVVLLGAIIAGLTAITGGLQVIFKDQPNVILTLGVINVVVAGIAVFKDQFVQGMVVPLKDTAVYVNDQGHTVAGPASPLADGTLVDPASTQEATDGM